MASDRVGRLTAARDSYERILVQLTLVVANPTQANVDLAVALLDGSGFLREKPDTSIDGESIPWAAYQEMVLRQIDTLDRLIQRVKPYVIQSRARP